MSVGPMSVCVHIPSVPVEYQVLLSILFLLLISVDSSNVRSPIFAPSDLQMSQARSSLHH